MLCSQDINPGQKLELLDLERDVTTNANPRHEKKSITMGFPLSLLQEGVHTNNQTNEDEMTGS